MSHKKPIEHGTRGGYRKHGCRCQECRDCEAEYQLRYRDRKRGGPAQNSDDHVAMEHAPFPGKWADRGACTGSGIDFFSDDTSESRRAIAVCDDCPVRGECYDYAIAIPSLWGVWGGTTRKGRQRIRSEERRAAA